MNRKNPIFSFILCAAMLIAVFVPSGVVLTGCKSPTVQKQAVNTLFTLHKTADAALDGYLDLINKGTVTTNGLPKVLAAYTTFQSAYNAAVVLVASNTNAVAPQSLQDASAAFANTITDAKKGL